MPLMAMMPKLFQHTAARRRLVILYLRFYNSKGFNTQPPEGGWAETALIPVAYKSFNTQPPEGGWDTQSNNILTMMEFQHTAARRRLAPA